MSTLDTCFGFGFGFGLGLRDRHHSLFFVSSITIRFAAFIFNFASFSALEYVVDALPRRLRLLSQFPIPNSPDDVAEIDAPLESNSVVQNTK